MPARRVPPADERRWANPVRAPDRHSTRCGTADRPGRGDRHAAAVRLAVVLSPLLLVLFGIVDVGRLLQQYIQLTEAAREGARVGALNGTVAQVQAEVSRVVGAGVPLTYPSAPATCGAGSPPGTDATVLVHRTFQPATSLMGLIAAYGGPGATLTVKATAVMPCVG